MPASDISDQRVEQLWGLADDEDGYNDDKDDSCVAVDAGSGVRCVRLVGGTDHFRRRTPCPAARRPAIAIAVPLARIPAIPDHTRKSINRPVCLQSVRSSA